MTPRTNVNSWLKAAIAAFVAIVLILLVMQLAGILFGSISKTVKPQEVTPLTIYSYWFWYGEDPSTRTTLMIASAVSAAALFLPVIFLLIPNRRKLHGEARWSRRGEMAKAGLFGNQGIIVGRLKAKYLTFNGAEQGKNVLVSASPGSGKTRGLMIPNCLSWPGSLVALDMKGECFDRTAGYRAAQGQNVYQLNFLARDYKTHQYDPFAYVSEDKHFRVAEIEKIARYLCPDPAQGDSFWAIHARGMFRAIALYLYESGQKCTLGGILDVVETAEGIQKFAKRIVKETQEGKHRLDAGTVRDLATIGNRSENTHSGIMDQLTGALAPLKNPIVRFATSNNTFDLREIRNRPTSVYLTIARPDLPALRPIINLFFQHLVDLNSIEEYGKNPSHKNEVLLAMDEFAQIGRLDSIFHGITFFRSYGFRLLAIVQSVSQLRETYSPEATKTFLESFDCSVFFTPAARDSQTPKELSDLLGKDTVKSKSQSKRKGFDTSHDSENLSDHGRPLMLPQEISRMPMTKEIILISGQHPIICDKINAWQEDAFTKRNGAAPSTPRMDLRETVVTLPGVAEAVEASAREAELADISQIEQLNLEDFSCDFSAIEAPQGKMTDDEIEKLRDVFLNTLAKAA